MRKLILIKHSAPEVNPAIPSYQWGLSEEGRSRCAALAAQLAAYAPAALYCSPEPKAVETAAVLGERLNLPPRTREGLQEHDRSNVAHMRSSAFISLVEAFFRRRDELVLGRETATAAADRIDRAVTGVLDQNPQGNVVAVVTHGTVLALLLERRCGLKPFAVWRAMGLPSFVVVSVPEWQVAERVDRVG